MVFSKTQFKVVTTLIRIIALGLLLCVLAGLYLVIENPEIGFSVVIAPTFTLIAFVFVTSASQYKQAFIPRKWEVGYQVYLERTEKHYQEMAGRYYQKKERAQYKKLRNHIN